jgi:hypothetical protein
VITRNEGYRRGVGKERLALNAFKDLAIQKNIDIHEIVDADENYRRGDFESANGSSIECKGQPIDPSRYRQNFIEVCEITQNTLHLRGFEDLAASLDLSYQELESVQVSNKVTGTRGIFGRPSCLSVSLTPMLGSVLTAYINATDGGRHIYLYRREEIMQHIRTAVRAGVVRGAGNSNQDTIAVFIPISEWRWERKPQAWTYSGIGSEPDAQMLGLG